ncbi:MULTISPECIES: hypothetical protein [unclassified Symbiopectobacterium]|uniref:hypothetical protein n=1 Tax=unclassified Symbiopectobacterium TaxID=2794573 RepID=UPI00222617EF|nr:MULTISPECIES: hypothetical protein [unclassified Symbiopectobacterium]MCW2473391.1 hypothetical protein [Candidatus Symbiopectobacterium sp. NZEC151]MCW2482106.1 hypothetical protein [Candidatus Symbiopectobacterium sp. NZEC135]
MLTYSQITQKAVDEIERLKKNSEHCSSTAEEMHRDWMHGVFLLWDKLTAGSQVDGDYERISNMVRH